MGLGIAQLEARARIDEERRKIRASLEAEALRRRGGENAFPMGGMDLPRRNLAPAIPALDAPPIEGIDQALPTWIQTAEPPSPPAIRYPTRVVTAEPPVPTAITYPTRTVGVSPPPADASFDIPTRTRSRLVGYDAAAPSSDQEALPTRPRLAHPKGTVEYQEKLLSDRETMPPEKMSRTQAALYAFFRSLSSGNLLTGGVGAAVGALAPGATSKLAQRDRIAEASGQLDTAIEREGRMSQIDSQRAAATARRNAPLDAEKARQEQERDNLRQLYNAQPYFDPDKNPEHRALRDRAAVLGMALPRRDEKDNNQLEYNDSDELLLVPRNGGPARPVFDQSGKPVKRRATRNLQLGHRLAPDGITVIQTQYDPDSGQFVDSAGPGGKPIVTGQVGRIDPATGAPVSSLISGERVTQQQRQENDRKRKSYESEAAEWTGKEKTFRANKVAEDRAIATKEEKLAALYAERPAGYFAGGRSAEAIAIDIARVSKDLETHRSNVTRFQTEADKAAGSATEARRNAGLYGNSGSGPSTRGAIGRPPAGDGKYHYSVAEIRAQAEAAGVSYQSLYNKLKANNKVAIDQ